MNDVTNETGTKSNSNMLLALFGTLVVLAIVGGGAYFYFNKSSDVTGNNDNTSVVARVNGEEISRAEYDRSVTQIKGAYTSQGADPNDPQVTATAEEQALNTLINRRLMSEAAAKSGIAVEDTEMETQYQAVITNIGGAEALQTALNQSGMSEADLKAEIRTDILINKYLESKLQISSITATDEEIETAYETAVANNQGTEEVPALADVRELISSQLVGEKQQVAINAEIERLRQEAEIEVLL